MEDLHIKLDLGSGNPEEGEIQPEGYILQDIAPHKNISLVCDVLKLDKHIKPGQCQKIRMSHLLEHFPTKDTVPILKMLHTLIEDGGELEIHVPNLKYHLSLILFSQDEEAITYMFGGQKDEYDFHKTGFTPDVLIKRVQEAGFTVTSCNIDNNIHLMAKK